MLVLTRTLSTAKKVSSGELHSLTFTPTDIHNLNTYEAAGPDSIPGRVLRACAEQLAGVFMDMLHIVMKCLERLVLVHLNKCLLPKLDVCM